MIEEIRKGANKIIEIREEPKNILMVLIRLLVDRTGDAGVGAESHLKPFPVQIDSVNEFYLLFC
jgi:hypothetical protein